ncbi:GDSL-type esterase/lipase family protein [Microbacterium sp. SA39]|uniref:GDSL-type esterase/lipase family protein n=1 Tax=Microbacterium sp. SA39 TaxID=1263625 RepID=UPI0005F9BA1F|nr:GDSL-type esterase/lipase family protein [Microbacterium sp. SA39]KJQ52732.1 hypothetical protein RS85_03626 [Microbacterium sp. SA39]
MIIAPLDDLVRGIAGAEQTPRGLAVHRLPEWVRRQFPDPQLLAMEKQPSGVRLEFETAATRVELVSHPSRVVYRDVERPRGRIDAFVDGALHVRDELGGGDVVEVDLQTGSSTVRTGEHHVTVLTGLSPQSKRVALWLPHNEVIELIELRSDAPVRAVRDDRPLWVHHGSSISQGSNALSPSEIWPVAVARQADVDLRNLGFGGSALVDPFLARVIRDAPADAISVKLGINVVNLDAMRLRAFVPAVHGFIDTIRDGHPETPLLIVSPIHCGIHEATPGPAAIDPETLDTGKMKFIATGAPGDTLQGRLTLEVIRDALRSIVEARSSDANLHYLDGLELFGAADADELPFADALHPDAEAHRLIARRFAERVFVVDGVFGEVGTVG